MKRYNIQASVFSLNEPNGDWVKWDDVQLLQESHKELLEVLQLALVSHGHMKMSNPPKDSWEYNKVDEKAIKAINTAKKLMG